MTDLATVLRGIPYFAALPAADLDALTASLTVRDYPDGHLFIKQGRRGDTAYLILDGDVVVTHERAGTVEEVNRLHRGELFGLVALVDEEPRSASCHAAGPVRVASLPQGAFALLFNSHAPIAYAIQRALAEQLARDFRHVNARIRKALLARHASQG